MVLPLLVSYKLCHTLNYYNGVFMTNFYNVWIVILIDEFYFCMFVYEINEIYRYINTYINYVLQFN